MHGALPPHLLYAFMAWCLDMWVTLLVPFIQIVTIFWWLCWYNLSSYFDLVLY